MDLTKNCVFKANFVKVFFKKLKETRKIAQYKKNCN